MAPTSAIRPAIDHRNVSVHDIASNSCGPRLLVVDRRDLAKPRPGRYRGAMPGTDSSVEPRSSRLAACRGSLGVPGACEHLLVLVRPVGRPGTLPDTGGCAVACVLPVRLPRDGAAHAISGQPVPAECRVGRTLGGVGNCVGNDCIGATP